MFKHVAVFTLIFLIGGFALIFIPLPEVLRGYFLYLLMIIAVFATCVAAKAYANERIGAGERSDANTFIFPVLSLHQP